MRLDDVTIGLTSFLRFGFLRNAIKDINYNYPECEVLTVDDSDGGIGQAVDKLTTTVVSMPFDSGIGAKRNEMVRRAKTQYLLMGTDDFLFDQQSRHGVELMAQALENNPGVDVACGRFNNNHYEGHIRHVPGEYIKEIPLDINSPRWGDNPECYRVDLTANYFLARTDRIAPWNEEMKIGGEHIMWFLRMLGWDRTLVWVPGAEIMQQPYWMGAQDLRYNRMRMRCWDGHNKMKELLNIKRYIGFDGAET